MKRTPLSIGSTIQAKGGSSYTYIIDRVIGDGASSIVYEAHYIDNAYDKLRNPRMLCIQNSFWVLCKLQASIYVL